MAEIRSLTKTNLRHLHVLFYNQSMVVADQRLQRWSNTKTNIHTGPSPTVSFLWEVSDKERLPNTRLRFSGGDSKVTVCDRGVIQL